jgi:cytochrome oxidase assembly protein ShyY1
MATAPSGYFLCTVFQLDNGNEILVNRGWMPANIAQEKQWSTQEVGFQFITYIHNI